MTRDTTPRPFAPWSSLVSNAGMGGLVFAVALALVGWRTWTRLNVPGAPVPAEWGFVDFRDAIYYPAVAVREGVNPYDIDRYRQAYPVGNIFPLYAPFVPYVHLPLGLLPYTVAEAAYVAVLAALTWGLAWLALRCAGLDAAHGPVTFLAAVLLVARPGHLNFVLGQMGLQSALLSLAAIHWADTSSKRAGVCLALACFKPTFGAPLAVLLLCRRNFATVTIGLALATLASLLAAGLLVATTGGLQPLLDAIPANQAALEGDPLASPAIGWMRSDALTGLVRLTDWTPGPLAPPALAVAMLVAAGIVLVRLGARPENSGADSLSGAIVALTTVTAIYHLFYDFLLLAGPLVAIIAGRRREWREMGAARWLVAGLIAVPFVNLLLSNTMIARLERGSVLWRGVTSANSVALVAAWAICLALGWKAARRA